MTSTTARRIRITAGPVSLDAELNGTRAAAAIWQALPLRAKAETWPGRAFCVFFGPTPASRGDEIRPASPVTVIGRVVGDAAEFRKVRAGDPVRVERADGSGRSA